MFSGMVNPSDLYDARHDIYGFATPRGLAMYMCSGSDSFVFRYSKLEVEGKEQDLDISQRPGIPLTLKSRGCS